MHITVIRNEFSATTTVGELHLDGVFQCYTLEDTVRKLTTAADKVYGKTAIPAGTYKVELSYSPHFGRVLPLIKDVPFFDGIRIHPGNTAADTDGCILVGVHKISEVGGPTLTIGSSRAAFDPLFAKLQGAKDITISIEAQHATA